MVLTIDNHNETGYVKVPLWDRGRHENENDETVSFFVFFFRVKTKTKRKNLKSYENEKRRKRSSGFYETKKRFRVFRVLKKENIFSHKVRKQETVSWFSSLKNLHIFVWKLSETFPFDFYRLFTRNMLVFVSFLYFLAKINLIKGDQRYRFQWWSTIQLD